MGRDLNPVVKLLFNSVVSIVEDLFSSFKKGRLPVLVEFGLLELVEEVSLDLAEWPVISLPVVSVELFLLFTISVRRAIVRVSSVFIDFIVSDPPELSTVVELLIIFLMLIFHWVTEDFVPEFHVLFFRLVFLVLVFHPTLPPLWLFLSVLILLVVFLVVVRPLLLFIFARVAPIELDVPAIHVEVPLTWVLLDDIHGVVLDSVLSLCNCCEHSIVF